MPPPIMARTSIGLRPYRSASLPQIGLVRASANPVALADTPVQKESSGPLGICSSRWRNSGRNGKAKEKPMMAVNSASQRAARFRRQLTAVST
jgi:hypothetical protein